MRTIQIVKPGLLSTIQDLGRYGYQKYGVVVSGAVDGFAARVANLLVGNDERESVLEMTYQGPTLTFQSDSLIAICGGDLSPMIESTRVPLWRPVFVPAGSILSFYRPVTGIRAYLAIAGGFDVEEILGSKSTYLHAGFGGFQGRALQSGDVLPLRMPSLFSEQILQNLIRQSRQEMPFKASLWGVSPAVFSYLPRHAEGEPVVIRALEGLEFQRFIAESQQVFYNCSYQITTKSDRMGVRLSGSPLMQIQQQELLSEAVTAGTVQVPADGQPIVLLSDRQTTGGYPRIAQVVSVDLPVLGQCQPGTRIRFQKIPLSSAQALYLQREREIRQLKGMIRSRIRSDS
jgi:antagonist of KipI